MSRNKSPLIIVPRQKILVRGFVVAVLTSRTGKKKTFESENIVTDKGDEFYSYRAVDAQPTDALFTNGAVKTFDGIMELYSGASAAPAKTNIRSDLVTLVTNSAQVIDATYPLRNDGDSDNTGAGIDVATYRVSYTTANANGTGIADVILTNPSPAAGEVLLMHAEFGATFNKTSSDTLKVFVNHTFNGV